MTKIYALLFLSFLSFEGSVTRVIDGDTFVIRDDVRVRLWGLSAPERGQPGYAEARDALRALIEGKAVYCEEKGLSYNRRVARCFVGGDDISKLMIESGTAFEACKFSKGFYGTCQTVTQE